MAELKRLRALSRLIGPDYYYELDEEFDGDPARFGASAVVVGPPLGPPRQDRMVRRPPRGRGGRFQGRAVG